MTKRIDEAARLAAAIFAFQGWKYGWRVDERVPDRKELADTIETLLRGAAKGAGASGTGRFHVAWNEDFERYEIMLILGDLTSWELYEETGIDTIVQKENYRA